MKAECPKLPFWRRCLRRLCRLGSEESGAVQMEYVIIAVLIAAACVLAVLMFGRTIVRMFDTTGRSATGDHTGAHDYLENKARPQQNTDAQRSKDYHDSMHK